MPIQNTLEKEESFMFGRIQAAGSFGIPGCAIVMIVTYFGDIQRLRFVANLGIILVKSRIFAFSPKED